MVAFVETEKTEAFEHHVRSAYLPDTGIKPEVYSVQVAAGAGLL